MRRAWRIAALGLGGTLLIGSVAFRAWAAPALIRFPNDVDETAHYSGTSSMYVDQKTLLPLAHPKTEPVTITRRVTAVAGSFNRTVVDETVDLQSPSTSTTETYQYVIDRRSMQMVADPRQYAFGNPKAVMHAAGAYRINFAMGTTADGHYLAYVPEADARVPLKLTEAAHKHEDVGITVIDFSSKLEKPVAPYYLAHLRAMGLPMQITAAQLQPQLLAAGIDVNKALADVGPHLTPAGSRLVSQILAKPVKLDYYFVDNGQISVEPKTGALIDVHAQKQAVAVAPDLSGVGVLQPLLNQYKSFPSVKALADGLTALAARPPQLAASYTYTQTIPSSRHAAGVARSNAQMMNLVEVRIPVALAVLGSMLLLGAGLLTWRARRRNAVVGSEPAVPETEQAEPDRAEPAGVPVGTRIEEKV